MQRLLKTAHLLGLALFLGSIPAHILLGRVLDPAADPQGFALLMHAKYVSVLALTLPGLALAVLTGIALMLGRRMTPGKLRWMAAKLALVALIVLNGAFILTPVSRDIAAAAQGAIASGILPASFAALARKEAIFGAANLAMILAVVGLAVFKPSLRHRTVPTGAREAVS